MQVAMCRMGHLGFIQDVLWSIYLPSDKPAYFLPIEAAVLILKTCLTAKCACGLPAYGWATGCQRDSSPSHMYNHKKSARHTGENIRMDTFNVQSIPFLFFYLLGFISHLYWHHCKESTACEMFNRLRKAWDYLLVFCSFAKHQSLCFANEAVVKNLTALKSDCRRRISIAGTCKHPAMSAQSNPHLPKSPLLFRTFTIFSSLCLA